MYDSPLPIPSHWQRVAGWLVLLGCEVAMTGCWILAGEILRPSENAYARDEHIRLGVAGLLLGLFPAWLAIRQYQALFRHYRRAASTTIAMLILVAVPITLTFLESTSMLMQMSLFYWCIHFGVLWVIGFAVVMNWKWGNQLQRESPFSARPPWQFSMSEIVGLMTALAIQFALAGVALRSR